jgi:hypothetical protein
MLEASDGFAKRALIFRGRSSAALDKKVAPPTRASYFYEIRLSVPTHTTSCSENSVLIIRTSLPLFATNLYPGSKRS